MAPHLPAHTPDAGHAGDADDPRQPALDLPCAADIAALAAANAANAGADSTQYTQLHRALRDQLDALLCAGHSDRIQHMLYRVDVDERRALIAWRSSSPGALADALARLILDRLLQIAQSRREQRFPVNPDEAW